MSSTRTSAETAEAARSQLQGKLGVTAILLMVVAAASPLGIVAGGVPIGALLGNGAGLPSLYLIAAGILLLFAAGYTAMAGRIARPGAFFRYIGVGLGSSAGAGSAWLALFTYYAMQAAIYSYGGAILSAMIVSVGGPDLPWYLYALVWALLIGVLGYRSIDVSARVLIVLVVAEVAIVLIGVAAIVLQGGAEGLSAISFRPDVVLSGAPGIGMMFVIGAFIGFEATAIFRGEARDPDRTIPKATYLAVAGMGAFYAVASWGLIMGWGPSQLVDVIAPHLDDIIALTFLEYVGVAGSVIVNVLLITSFFASLLGFHNIIARYQHAMAGAGIVPSRLGSVHAAHRSPHVASLVQTVVAAGILIAVTIAGLDPILQVYSWLSGVGTLGVLILMSITALAVIVYFVRDRRGFSLWRTAIAPALGLIGLVITGIVIVINFPLLVGDVDAAGNPAMGAVSSVLIALLVLVPAAGVAQSFALRRRDPAAYGDLSL